MSGSPCRSEPGAAVDRTAPASTRRESSGSPRTVLVADDEPGLPELYEAWLDHEWDVRIARDGEEALVAFDRTVDVVLLDRQMPLVHGDDVSRRIRGQNRQCPIGMISATEPDPAILGLPLDDYLEKPIDRRTLQGTIDQLHSRRTFDACVREYFALSSKLRALSASSNDADVRRDDAYRRAERRLDELHGKAETAMMELSDPQPALVDLLRTFGR